MKQVIFILGLLTLTITKSFAADPVSSAIEKTFQSKFAKATEVSWSQANGFTVAAFTLDGKRKYAYYNQWAELVVIAEPIQVGQLSEAKQTNLNENFEGYSVVEAYKMKSEENTRYYLVIENEKEKIILNSNDSDWEIVKRSKK